MKLNRNEKYVKWGLTAFLVIVAAGLFWLVFSNLRGFYDLIVEFLNIIAALLNGCLFAYLMNPVMKVTQRIMDKLLAKRNLSDRMAARISKITGICAAVLVFCLAVYALIALIVPNLIASIEELLQPEKLESYYATISKWFRGIFTNSDIQSFLEKTVGDPLEMVIGWLKKLDYSVIVTSLTSSVYSVVMVIFNILLGIVAAVYILIFKEELCAQAKKVTVAVFSRQHADRLLELARRTNSIFGGYVMGKIIDAVLVGVITYFGVLFMGMPYAALIGTIVGVTNIIPFFGPFLGAVPSALLLMIDKPVNALYFCIFILILQQVDGNIIENRILGEKLGISDFWVLVAILVFGGIFGFAGMLLGVPVFAVLYTVIGDRVNKRLARKRHPLQTSLYYTIRTVDDLPPVTEPSYTSAAEEPAYETQIDPDDDMEIDDPDYDDIPG